MCTLLFEIWQLKFIKMQGDPKLGKSTLYIVLFDLKY